MNATFVTKNSCIIQTYAYQSLTFHSVTYVLDDHFVLINPPHEMAISCWLDYLKTHHFVSGWSYLWLSELTPWTLTRLNALKQAVPELTLFTSESLKAQLLENDVSLTIHTLDDAPLAKTKQHWHVLEATALQPKGAHLLYFPEAKLFLSQSLFSQTTSEFDKEDLKRTHEQLFHNSDLLKPILRKIKTLDITLCVPAKGPLYDEKTFKQALVSLLQHTFYDEHFIVKKAVSQKRYYNYDALIQQALIILQTHVEDSRFKTFLKDINLLVEESSFEVIEAPLSGHKLWHFVFQRIQAELGIEALSVLEPFVQKMHKRYHTPMPNIYQTHWHALEAVIAQKEDEKRLLQTSIDSLHKQLKDTENKLTKDPLTNRYNEAFFRTFIHEHHREPWHIMLISVDRFQTLNRRLGIQGANDVLKTLSYLIEETLPSQTLIFKYTGTQFVVMMPVSFDLKNQAERLRNAVRESVLFAEPIDVNIATLASESLREKASAPAPLSAWFKVLDARLMKAQSAGQGAIIMAGDDGSQTLHKTLLIVDEDDVNVRLITRYFERTDFQCIACSGVDEALDILQKTPVQAIISELNLSKLDGFSLKQRLNEDARLESLPFIIASHNKNERTLKRAYDLNVDVVLQKPVFLDEVHGLLNRLIKGTQR